MRLKTRILSIIQRYPEGISEEQIQAHLGFRPISRVNFSGAIKRLIKQGKIKEFTKSGLRGYRANLTRTQVK